jgi:hypothetical protein
MSALYDELVKLDKPIADRWKARLRGDPKRTLGPMDADAILKPLMQPDRTISDSETRAIAKMVTWGEWTPEALAVIRVIVRVGVEGGLFQNGGDIFVSPEKLRPVSSALGAGMTGKIAFKSPGTNFSYVPGHYQAIQQLISQSKIVVLEIRLYGLEIIARITTGGEYHSDANRLYIFAGKTPPETAMMIVHEATHAIQDWQDVAAKNKYIEADAYIAGAVADLAQGGNVVAAQTGLIYPAATSAAKLVLAGRGNPADPAWDHCYKAVVEGVEKSDAYKETNEMMFDPSRKDEGPREKTRMDEILAAVAQKAP